MNSNQVIEKVYNNELSANDAYTKLYPSNALTPKLKKAHFVKLRIRVPDEGKGVNTFLKILFAIPLPLIFAKIGLRIAKKHVDSDEIDFDQIKHLLTYAKGTVINVDSEDAKVDIKIF